MITLDFETYSEAGCVWSESSGSWIGPPGAPKNKKGLSVVGAYVYATHPSTEVLLLAYDIPMVGAFQWVPGMPAPHLLLEAAERGELLEAHNAMFERLIWTFVCARVFGWPVPNPWQWRCSLARCRAWNLPPSLASAGEVLRLPIQKQENGAALIRHFCGPLKPTRGNPFMRNWLGTDQKSVEFRQYNRTDVEAEKAISASVPELSPQELAFWQMDQEINFRGVQIDLEGVEALIRVIEAAYQKHEPRLFTLTGGQVQKATEVERLLGWLHGLGVHLDDLSEETVDEALEGPLPDSARAALEIRALIGSASVKKLYALRLQTGPDGRAHGLFNYHGARTGRTTGNGPQPTNLPNSGPECHTCQRCATVFDSSRFHCPACGDVAPPPSKAEEWSAEHAASAIGLAHSSGLPGIESCFASPLRAVAGCLRGMFIAGPGKELISADYTAIEAVGLAALAGEEWRLEVFRTHGKIYEASAASIKGLKLEELLEYKKQHGKHHPLRKMGKVAELASGYGGWVGSWLAFGAGEFLSEEEIKAGVLAWRAASPNIVEFWGGQTRRHYGERVPELYGVEGHFIAAMLNPGAYYEFRGIGFQMRAGVMYIRLLSGRELAYHRPRLLASDRRAGEYAIQFEGYNTNPKTGPVGWITMDTYGPRLTENIVQATCRDIQWHGMLNLERNGYPIVLHVYDEDVSEVPAGFGSEAEYCRIMEDLPQWAAGWPIKAAGAWRGKRYRK